MKFNYKNLESILMFYNNFSNLKNLLFYLKDEIKYRFCYFDFFKIEDLISNIEDKKLIGMKNDSLESDNITSELIKLIGNGSTKVEVESYEYLDEASQYTQNKVFIKPVTIKYSLNIYKIKNSVLFYRFRVLKLNGNGFSESLKFYKENKFKLVYFLFPSDSVIDDMEDYKWN